MQEFFQATGRPSSESDCLSMIKNGSVREGQECRDVRWMLQGLMLESTFSSEQSFTPSDKDQGTSVTEPGKNWWGEGDASSIDTDRGKFIGQDFRHYCTFSSHRSIHFCKRTNGGRSHFPLSDI